MTRCLLIALCCCGVRGFRSQRAESQAISGAADVNALDTLPSWKDKELRDMATATPAVSWRQHELALMSKRYSKAQLAYLIRSNHLLTPVVSPMYPTANFVSPVHPSSPTEKAESNDCKLAMQELCGSSQGRTIASVTGVQFSMCAVCIAHYTLREHINGRRCWLYRFKEEGWCPELVAKTSTYVYNRDV